MTKLIRSNPKLKLLTGLFLFSTVFNACAFEQDKEYSLTILHTNDHHGHFWMNEKGEYGLAAQKTLVDNIRKEVAAENGELLVLSGGDINTGVPESDMQDAEPDFIGMNAVGYDAMAIGNHEFDNSTLVLFKQQQWANFPFLSANIYDKKTGQRLFDAYKIFEKQGLKIAVIGLTTEDTPVISNPQNVAGLDFRDPKEEAKKVIAELKATEKPDIIIAATHMGHYENGNHGSNAPGDVELARFLNEGDLDMIVGGHSQNPVCMESENKRQKDYRPGTPCAPDRQNGTWIVQAHEWGKYVGRADYTFKNGTLTLTHYELIPINLKETITREDGSVVHQFYTQEIAQDPKLLETLTAYQEKGESQLKEVIGSSTVDLEGERQKVRSELTNLGKLITMSMKERTKADVCVISGGNIRSSLAKGNITYRDVLMVEPFENDIVYSDIKGSELLDYVKAVSGLQKGSGAYPQWFDITYQLDDGKLSDIKLNGEAIDPNKLYRICTLTFIADGGDGYPVLKNYINTGFKDAEILKDYIEKHSPITEEMVAF